MHRAWVAETFGPDVAHLPESERRATLDLLSVVTDVYTWKQLRRDQGASRAVTQARMTALVAAVLASSTGHEEG